MILSSSRDDGHLLIHGHWESRVPLIQFKGGLFRSLNAHTPVCPALCWRNHSKYHEHSQEDGLAPLGVGRLLRAGDA